MIVKEKPFRVLVISSLKSIRSVRNRLKLEENIIIDSSRFANISAVLSEKGAEIYSKKKSIRQYDFAWFQSASMTKDVAYMLSLYFDSIGVPHTSPEIGITKLVDLFMLAAKNTAIPKTYFCSRSRLAVELSDIVEKLKFPFLLKSTIGLGGNDVHLIEDAKDFFELVSTLPETKKYICQEFIPNHFDYRILVGNGVVLSAEKRIRQKDTYRNNVAQGAIEEFLDVKYVPEEVKALAVKSADICQLQWAGVDVVTSDTTGKHYVLEVNRRPGVTKGSTEVQAVMTFLKNLKKNYGKQCT